MTTIATLIILRRITSIRFAACCWLTVVAMMADVWIVGSLLA